MSGFKINRENCIQGPKLRNYNNTEDSGQESTGLRTDRSYQSSEATVLRARTFTAAETVLTVRTHGVRGSQRADLILDPEGQVPPPVPFFILLHAPQMGAQLAPMSEDGLAKSYVVVRSGEKWRDSN